MWTILANPIELHVGLCECCGGDVCTATPQNACTSLSSKILLVSLVLFLSKQDCTVSGTSSWWSWTVPRSTLKRKWRYFHEH